MSAHPGGTGSRKPEKPRENALYAYGGVMRDVDTLEKLAKALPGAGNRHGDLQIMLSTAKRVVERLETLIAWEELQP